MTRPRVKICCISSIYEARIAIEHGASALGLVGRMPSGPGVIEDELINQIVRTVPPPISTFVQQRSPISILKTIHNIPLAAS